MGSDTIVTSTIIFFTSYLKMASIPKGTRDFAPEIMAKRNYIFSIIRMVFGEFGYQQIETPSMENLDTLMGKYGEEGDKLIFKILNSGDFLKDVTEQDFASRNANSLATKISEKALRYDLTVPFARFVVMHQNEISFPFKRYQIQPVWRADRPQKGRYREFYQCDADVVGSDSLLHEVEFVQMIDKVMSHLKINTAIKLNNRKILSGVAEVAGIADRMMEMTIAIDKLDKIGKEGVVKELQERGFSDKAIKKISVLFELNKSSEENLATVASILGDSEIGTKGIEELQYIFNYIKRLGLQTAQLEFDVTLARGLNYYTGAIFEVKALDTPMGSICGGGRYDDLTGIFGLKGVSGVGISFGADRIYDVMNELNLFPSNAIESTKVLFANFGTAEEQYCMKILKELRCEGIKAEIYPEASKMKKQFKYADDKAIPFVAVIGESEMAENKVSLKNMKTSEQQTLSIQELKVFLH